MKHTNIFPLEMCCLRYLHEKPEESGNFEHKYLNFNILKFEGGVVDAVI